VLCCTVLCCTVLYCTVLYCTVLLEELVCCLFIFFFESRLIPTLFSLSDWGYQPEQVLAGKAVRLQTARKIGTLKIINGHKGWMKHL